ncbi:MAG: malate synthase A, partial [Brachybacterium tyrofermentans]
MTLTQDTRPTRPHQTAQTDRSDPTRPGPSAERGTLEVLGAMSERFEEILTPAALDFVAGLHDLFHCERHRLLQARTLRRESIAAGAMFDFLPTTAAVREDPEWTVAGSGPGLEDRRVEITGPTDRRMTVNAMNSGARVWLADHED